MSDDQNKNHDLEFKSELSKRLLNDDDFEQWVTAKFEKSQKQVDPFTHERVWKNIKSETFGKKSKDSMRYLPIMSAIAAVIMVGLMSRMFWQENNTIDKTQIKGSFQPIVQLDSYILEVDQETTENDAGNADPIHLFRFTSSEPGYYLLLVKKMDGSIDVAVQATSFELAHEWQHVAFEEELFGYQLDTDETSASFCLIVSETAHKVPLTDAALLQLFNSANQSQCVAIRRGG